MNNKVLETKIIENQPRLKEFRTKFNFDRLHIKLELKFVIYYFATHNEF